MNRILLVEDENGAVEVFRNLLSFHSADFQLVTKVAIENFYRMLAQQHS